MTMRKRPLTSEKNCSDRNASLSFRKQLKKQSQSTLLGRITIDRSVNLKHTSANRKMSTTIRPKETSQNFYLVRDVVKPTRNSLSRNQDSTVFTPALHRLRKKTKFRAPESFHRSDPPTAAEQIFTHEFQQLKSLHYCMTSILQSIQLGQKLQTSIAEYYGLISDKKLHFIDSFINNSNSRLYRTVHNARVYEYLSIIYLFLEKIETNESGDEPNTTNLINFINFCLSNVLLFARMFILSEKGSEFGPNHFEHEIEQFEVIMYGKVLKNLQSVILRMQHNNDTISAIHRKISNNHKTFHESIQPFLRRSERQKHSLSFCFHYLFENLAMHIEQQELRGFSKTLQVAPVPYLPNAEHEYTLVIEPIGVLANETCLRPYLLQFLQWAQKFFDIVMWTWRKPSEIQRWEKLMQPYLFSKLYGYHCIESQQVYTKDLYRIDRDLQKTVIIDYDQRIYAHTPNNGIVSRWDGQKDDRGLIAICEVLGEMISSHSTVQQTLTHYAEQLRYPQPVNQ